MSDGSELLLKSREVKEAADVAGLYSKPVT